MKNERSYFISIICFVVVLGLIVIPSVINLDYGNTENARIEEKPKPKSREYISIIDDVLNREMNDAERTDILDALEEEYKNKKMSFVGTVTRIIRATSHYEIALTSIHNPKLKAQCNVKPSDDNALKAIYDTRPDQIKIVVGNVWFFSREGKTVFLNNCEIDTRG